MPSSAGLEEAVRLRLMWQVAPAGRSLRLPAVEGVGESGQSLAVSVNWVKAGVSRAERTVCGAVPRLVRVRVRVAGELVEVWTPKSSSLGETTMELVGVAELSDGITAVWVVALAACAVMVPGPAPVSRREHSAPAGRVEPQLSARERPVAVSWRPVASAE